MQNASRFWLHLPAYAALLVALGAACRALAHFITNADVTVYLWATLIVTATVSIGVQCGNRVLRRWSARVRVLLFVFLPVSAFLFNATVLAPLEAEAEINATVSLIVGWATLFCVLLIGMRYGTNAKGEQRVPLAAPLVPALSLFGLLNSLSVDTIVQICFVIFVAASLYLIAYERMLGRVLNSASKHSESAPEYSPSRSAAAFPDLSRLPVRRAAVSYLLACSLWFAVFMGGAALFYYPVAAILPRVMGMPLNAVRGASASLLDWRGGSSTIELRGGNYPLSDREVMKIQINPQKGEVSAIPALWRGRIYEIYSDSRWSENTQTKVVTLRVKRGLMTPLKAAIKEARSKQQEPSKPVIPTAPLSTRLIRLRPFNAVVEPQRSRNLMLFFPGELSALRGMPQVQAFTNGTFSAASSFRLPPYALRAQVKEERLSPLKSAPGLSPAELKRWRSNPRSALSLGIDADLKKQLAPIIAQIKMEALSTPRGRFDTPAGKANAIRDYLTRTCIYSLSSPLVPANQDAVIFFLTRSKTGACDMFASSMTMLLRAANVPARLATGYVDPEEIVDQQTFSGTNNIMNYMVRERSAHAWVEYYIPGAGWLNYDPTAGTRTTELPIEERLAGIFDFPVLHLNFETLWLPGLGFLLIVTGLLWSFFDLRFRNNNEKLTAAEMERARIIEVYGQAAALFARRVPRAKHQTPLEYEAEIQRSPIAAAAKQEFSALTYLVMRARYHHQPPAANQEELQACLSRLRQAL